MNLKSIILGCAITVVLLAVLVATRMMVLTQATPEFEIREVDTVSLPEPPPPPPEQAPAEDVPPPPPPALEDLHVSLDVSQPVLPVSLQRVNPRMAVDSFFTDEPPAPLPVIAKATPRQVAKPEVRVISKSCGLTCTAGTQVRLFCRRARSKTAAAAQPIRGVSAEHQKYEQRACCCPCRDPSIGS